MPATTPMTANALPMLQRLQHVEVLPEQYSPCMNLLSTLKKVDHIEISDSTKSKNGHAFMIDIYLTPHSKNRIPTNQKQQIHSQQATISGGSTRTPAFRVERTLSEFIDFRSRLHRQARASHNGASTKCAYCTKVVNYILTGTGQPTPMMPWFTSTQKLQRQLAQFTNEVLALALLCKPSACPRCESQERIPELVSDLLAIAQAS